jgi:hypothetical protein
MYARQTPEKFGLGELFELRRRQKAGLWNSKDRLKGRLPPLATNFVVSNGDDTAGVPYCCGIANIPTRGCGLGLRAAEWDEPRERNPSPQAPKD